MRRTSLAIAFASAVISAWLDDDEFGLQVRADVINIPQKVKVLVKKILV